eukprot:TRINITY_DN7733_c0_g1_i4.p1 TRINITY_DN7733_c0_g1~~TRINITY_DN7733_c0_g1_i4.p1  ORF type:complete len:2248 (+),score=588.32 TRINITY_DN7733_c0_g1_i4:464-6745(+)
MHSPLLSAAGVRAFAATQDTDMDPLAESGVTNSQEQAEVHPGFISLEQHHAAVDTAVRAVEKRSLDQARQTVADEYRGRLNKVENRCEVLEMIERDLRKVSEINGSKVTKLQEKMQWVRNDMRPLSDMLRRQELVNVDDLRKEIAFYKQEREYLYSKIFGCDMDFKKDEDVGVSPSGALPTRGRREVTVGSPADEERKNLKARVAKLQNQLGKSKQRAMRFLRAVCSDEVILMEAHDRDANGTSAPVARRVRRRPGSEMKGREGRQPVRSPVAPRANEPDQNAGDMWNTEARAGVEDIDAGDDGEWLRIVDSDEKLVDIFMEQLRLPSGHSLHKLFQKFLQRVLRGVSTLIGLVDSQKDEVRDLIAPDPHTRGDAMESFRQHHNQAVDERKKLTTQLRHMLKEMRGHLGRSSVSREVQTDVTVPVAARTHPGLVLESEEEVKAADERCPLCNRLKHDEYETDSAASESGVEVTPTTERLRKQLRTAADGGELPEGVRRKWRRRDWENETQRRLKEQRDADEKVKDEALQEHQRLVEEAENAWKSAQLQRSAGLNRKGSPGSPRGRHGKGGAGEDPPRSPASKSAKEIEDLELQILRYKAKADSLEAYIRTKNAVMEGRAVQLHHTIFGLIRRLAEDLQIPTFAIPREKPRKVDSVKTEVQRFTHIVDLLGDDEVALRQYHDFIKKANNQAMGRVRANVKELANAEHARRLREIENRKTIQVPPHLRDDPQLGEPERLARALEREGLQKQEFDAERARLADQLEIAIATAQAAVAAPPPTSPAEEPLRSPGPRTRAREAKQATPGGTQARPPQRSKSPQSSSGASKAEPKAVEVSPMPAPQPTPQPSSKPSSPPKEKEAAKPVQAAPAATQPPQPAPVRSRPERSPQKTALAPPASPPPATGSRVPAPLAGGGGRSAVAGQAEADPPSAAAKPPPAKKERAPTPAAPTKAAAKQRKVVVAEPSEPKETPDKEKPAEEPPQEAASADSGTEREGRTPVKKRSKLTSSASPTSAEDADDSLRKRRRQMAPTMQVREKHARRAQYTAFCHDLKQNFHEFLAFFTKYAVDSVGLHSVERIVQVERKRALLGKEHSESNPWRPTGTASPDRHRCPDCKRQFTSSPYCPHTGKSHVGRRGVDGADESASPSPKERKTDSAKPTPVVEKVAEKPVAPPPGAPADLRVWRQVHRALRTDREEQARRVAPALAAIEVQVRRALTTSARLGPAVIDGLTRSIDRAAEVLRRMAALYGREAVYVLRASDVLRGAALEEEPPPMPPPVESHHARSPQPAQLTPPSSADQPLSAAGIGSISQSLVSPKREALEKRSPFDFEGAQRAHSIDEGDLGHALTMHKIRKPALGDVTHDSSTTLMGSKSTRMDASGTQLGGVMNVHAALPRKTTTPVEARGLARAAQPKPEPAQEEKREAAAAAAQETKRQPQAAKEGVPRKQPVSAPQPQEPAPPLTPQPRERVPAPAPQPQERAPAPAPQPQEAPAPEPALPESRPASQGPGPGPAESPPEPRPPELPAEPQHPPEPAPPEPEPPAVAATPAQEPVGADVQATPPVQPERPPPPSPPQASLEKQRPPEEVAPEPAPERPARRVSVAAIAEAARRQSAAAELPRRGSLADALSASAPQPPKRLPQTVRIPEPAAPAAVEEEEEPAPLATVKSYRLRRQSAPTPIQFPESAPVAMEVGDPSQGSPLSHGAGRRQSGTHTGTASPRSGSPTTASPRQWFTPSNKLEVQGIGGLSTASRSPRTPVTSAREGPTVPELAVAQRKKDVHKIIEREREKGSPKTQHVPATLPVVRPTLTLPPPPPPRPKQTLPSAPTSPGERALPDAVSSLVAAVKEAAAQAQSAGQPDAPTQLQTPPPSPPRPRVGATAARKVFSRLRSTIVAASRLKSPRRGLPAAAGAHPAHSAHGPTSARPGVASRPRGGRASAPHLAQRDLELRVGAPAPSPSPRSNDPPTPSTGAGRRKRAQTTKQSDLPPVARPGTAGGAAVAFSPRFTRYPRPWLEKGTPAAIAASSVAPSSAGPASPEGSNPATPRMAALVPEALQQLRDTPVSLQEDQVIVNDPDQLRRPPKSQVQAAFERLGIRPL